MKVVLELQDQPSNVRKVTVRHDIVIGRGSDCNLRLSAPQISRRHCFLRVGREGVSVTDLDSSNGTFVDGKRLKGGVRQELFHGSVLALGPVRFLMHIKEDAVSEDVLKPAGQKQTSMSATSQHSSESSTVIGDANSLLFGSLPPMARAMGISVEQAGTAAESDEVTADIEGNAARPKTGSTSDQSSSPPHMDSVAETVEPGRRIAAMDADQAADAAAEPDDVEQAHFESRATVADATDLLEPEEFSSPSARVAEADVTEPEPDIADAALEDWSFFDDQDEDYSPPSPQPVAEVEAAFPNEDVASMELAASDWDFAEIVDDEPEVVNVVEEAETEEPEAVAVDVVEVLDDVEPDLGDVEVPDDVLEQSDEDAPSWFAASSGDDDDADPELQKFLKGF